MADLKERNPYLEAMQKAQVEADKKNRLARQKERATKMKATIADRENDLIEAYKEAKAKFGPEDNQTILRFQVLDMFEKQKNIVEQALYLEDSFAAFGELEETMADCLSMVDEITTASSSRKRNSVFYRMRLSYRIKRFVKNMTNKQKNLMVMMNQMQKSSQRFNKMFDKMYGAGAVSKKKKGEPYKIEESSLPSDIQDRINGVAGFDSASDDGLGSSSSSVAPKTAPKSSSITGEPGVDDII